MLTIAAALLLVAPAGIRAGGGTADCPVNAAAKRPDDAGLKNALQLWLKADARPWQDGQAVHLWEDASGRGHDLAATAGARSGGTGGPARFVARSSIAGFPAVRFEADTGLGGNAASAPDISGDAEFTMFVVTSLRGEQPTAEGLLAGFGEPAPQGIPGRARCAIIGVQPGGAGRAVLVGGWGNDAAAPPSAPLLDGLPTIIVLTKTRGPLAATARYFLNGLDAGALTGHSEVPDFGKRGDLGFMMGRVQNWSRGFAGDVAEVLLYNRALTISERSEVEAHLSGKFRIPLLSAKSWKSVRADPEVRPKHWAFEPMANPVPPGDAPHPIDAFIGAAWRERGLQPVPQADARTLVRRLFFDLHGLPPSPLEMDAAVASLTPWDDAAWARLTDTLLASAHYGERWGRHWLDVARYADTAGDNADYPVPEARLYRDYVIDAFNADKPYDQFVREQLAGDLLAADGPRDRYAERVTATGFLALSRRYATGPYEFWHLTLEDTIDTVGQAFMGLTLKCARCHDHKFDPVTQRDYYALYGIFESTGFPWPGGEEFASKKLPRLKFAPLVPPSEAEPRLRAHEEAAKRTPLDAASRTGYPPKIPCAYAVQEGVARHAVLHVRGDPEQPGPVVPRGVPAFLTPEQPRIPPDESGRRQLADWLTRQEHPLTARVMVNRVWLHHFGQGLVATPSNFGTRGAAPSNPALLDWLAREFITRGWSLKSLHRLILTSRTWRLACADNEANSACDPANEFLWRHDRRRLDAEAIRDSFLAVSGRLDATHPGPHPFQPVPAFTYTQHNQFRDIFPGTCRSVYLMTPRLQRHPFLALFDGPDTNTTAGLRTSAIVPSQALYLMNSAEMQTEAKAFAERVLAMSPGSRIAAAYALAFQRPPAAEESARANDFLAACATHADESSSWMALCRTLLCSHEFFHIE